MDYYDNESFNKFFDSVHPAVKIGGLTFDASRVLFECDIIAYRLAVLEYLDTE